MHPFSFAPGSHNTCTSQISQMSRNFGLALPQYLHEIADAHFLAAQQVQKPQAGAIGERRKQKCQIIGFRRLIHNFIICALTDTSRREYIRFNVYKETP